MEKFKIKSISIKVARPCIFVGTPSTFESLRPRQIDLYRKNISGALAREARVAEHHG